MVHSDPEFSRVVNDPNRSRASMQAIRQLFHGEEDERSATDECKTQDPRSLDYMMRSLNMGTGGGSTGVIGMPILS